MKLALRIGRWDVDALMREIPIRKLMELKADYDDDPWGEERADWRAGRIASVVYNAWRDKSQSAVSARDFMLHPPPLPKRSDDYLKGKVSLIRKLVCGRRPKNGNDQHKQSGG